MPRKPTDYSRTVIYKIVCNDLSITDVYVGHTTDFIKRKCKHKCTVNNANDRLYCIQLYKTIRENGGWDNYSMLEIEKYPCKDSNEARLRERFHYEQLNANLNMVCPILTKEETAQYCKTYIENNKLKAKQYNKEYRETNKDLLKIKQKEYRNKHKERYKEYFKNYYERKKNVIKTSIN